MKTIRFYRVNEEYGYFSNFAKFPIFIDQNVWPTVEHYFQASKFNDDGIRSVIRNIDSAMEAAEEGRNRQNPLRDDWEQIKEAVMKRALIAKFFQHPILRKNILATENAILIEHTANDSFWGDGGNGQGQNKLGTLLMEVRMLLNSINPDLDIILPPWIAFPEIDQHDMFWRMGLGEDYLADWSKYYLHLTDKANYITTFPEPKGWEEFYDLE